MTLAHFYFLSDFGVWTGRMDWCFSLPVAKLQVEDVSRETRAERIEGSLMAWPQVTGFHPKDRQPCSA
jgi:hypothetical protein